MVQTLLSDVIDIYYNFVVAQPLPLVNIKVIKSINTLMNGESISSPKSDLEPNNPPNDLNAYLIYYQLILCDHLNDSY